ncbi:hypothetical protein T261_8558 [Streptomyces lydicus]|nr:hypothetical protein T261_8558 [Streptomyces lydicus]
MLSKLRPSAAQKGTTGTLSALKDRHIDFLGRYSFAARPPREGQRRTQPFKHKFSPRAAD